MKDLMVRTIQACKDLKSLPYNQIKGLVSRMIKEDRCIIEDQGFAFYLKCDDDTLKYIATHPGIFDDVEKGAEILSKTGKNVHFIGVYSTDPDGNVFKSIVKGMGHLIEKEHPKTISWYNRNREFILRRVKCQKPRFLG